MTNAIVKTAIELQSLRVFEKQTRLIIGGKLLERRIFLRFIKMFIMILKRDLRKGEQAY